MLTQAETRRLKDQRQAEARTKGEKVRPFTQENRYLPPGIVQDVVETCAYFYVDDVKIIVDELELGDVPVFYKRKEGNGNYRWSKMTIDDVICMVGIGEYADAVGPLKFKGGPQIECRPGTKDKPYKLMTGTLLTWCMDQILYYVSIRGNDVWKQLGIPL